MTMEGACGKKKITHPFQGKAVFAASCCLPGWAVVVPAAILGWAVITPAAGRAVVDAGCCCGAAVLIAGASLVFSCRKKALMLEWLSSAKTHYFFCRHFRVQGLRWNVAVVATWCVVGQFLCSLCLPGLLGLQRRWHRCLTECCCVQCAVDG